MLQSFGLPRPRIILMIIALFATAAFLTYGSSLRNGFVSWDDNGLIYENPTIKGMNLHTVSRAFSSYDPELYIPLTFLSYQLDYVIGGLNPVVYHTTNLIFHTLNALLVTAVIFLFLGSGWLSIGLGLIFLLHPLNTEAVAWASARKDVLSTLFFLCSLYAYLQFRSNNSRKLFYIASLFFFLAGLLSKVMVITLPIVFLLIDWLEGRKSSKKMILEKIPYIFLALIFGVVAIFGKTNVLGTSTLWQKIIMAPKSTMFYLWKFLAPYNLSFAYPYNGVIRVSSPEFFLPLIALLVLIIFVFLLRKKYPIIFFGSAFYLLTLVPTFTNFLKGGDVYIASDRYAYVPMIGLLLVIGSVLQLWLEKTTTVREQRMRALFAGGCFVVLTCVFMIASHAQATTWKDSAALNTHAIDVYHDTRPALHNLGMDYLEKGDPEKALELLNASLTVKDDMRTRVSKGAAFVALGRLDDARREFEGVLLKDPQNPDAYYGIGNLEYRLGRRESAIVYFKKTLVVRPDYANALNNLGGLYIEMQQWDNAIDVLQTSIAHRPDFAESYYNLGGAYEAKKMLPEAMKSYEKAIVLQPKNADALARLAKLEYAGGDIDKAAGLLQRALDLDGGNETAYSLLMMMRKDGVAD